MTIEDIWDAYQDMLLDLEADLETGSHHFNNIAAEKFRQDYPRFSTAMTKLGEVIDQKQIEDSRSETL